jgi:hypothetical protein
VTEPALRAVVRDIVVTRSPEEAPLLDGLQEMTDDEITRLMRGSRKERGGPLGFGLPDAVTLATPVVWLIVHEISQKAAESAAESAVSGVKSRVRRLLRRPQPERSVPPLTPEQLQQVHQQTYDRAVAADMEATAAEALADGVVSRLARIPVE